MSTTSENKEENAVTVSELPNVEQYLRSFGTLIRQFMPQQQRVALAIYCELARGAPVDPHQFGQTLGMSLEEVRTLFGGDPLKSFIHSDQQGRILGFGGLSTVPTHHNFEVDGRALFAWCAGDTLFIPAYLGRQARVRSNDPETGELVELTVGPDRVVSITPESAVISFVDPESALFGTTAEQMMQSYCHFIFFFASRASGERWVARHPGTFLYSIAEGFAFTKRASAMIFGPAPSE
ncbi:MAG TPA: organomercurial lyase [Terracidiphilus sp.]